MLTTIIALLISLGTIASEADFNNLSQTEQDAMIENIIIDDQTQQ